MSREWASPTLISTSSHDSPMLEVEHLHRTLAARFEFGKRLDGFYIPLAKARKSETPRGLVYGAHGRIHHGGSDDAWALHLEHLHASAYIRLQDPSPNRIFPTADWKSLRSALYRHRV